MSMIGMMVDIETLKQRVDDYLLEPSPAERFQRIEDRLAKIEAWIASRPGRKPKDEHDGQ